MFILQENNSDIIGVIKDSTNNLEERVSAYLQSLGYIVCSYSRLKTTIIYTVKKDDTYSKFTLQPVNELEC